MRTDEALALLDLKVARVRLAGINGSKPRPSEWFDWLDFNAVFKREIDDAWLVENVWPSGRQVHLHAERKTGKSLVALWIACNLAIGRDPFTNAPIEPVKVAYLDFEMTLDDLRERLEDMGFTAEQLIGRLYYALFPSLPMLDTKAGGERLLEVLKYDGVQACIIDTCSRVVAGEESSNETYIKFFKHTGVLLKAEGIALLRLDHEGHVKGRSRGASAKADDVDVVFQLAATDEGYSLNRMASRIAWIPERVLIRKTDDPTLKFTEANSAWPAGTKDKAEELDGLGLPVAISVRAACAALKAAGMTAKTTTVAAAVKFRKRKADWGIK